MWKQSVWTSTISSHLATKYLKEGGLLTLTGAKAALVGTPGKMEMFLGCACWFGQHFPWPLIFRLEISVVEILSSRDNF